MKFSGATLGSGVRAVADPHLFFVLSALLLVLLVLALQLGPVALDWRAALTQPQTSIHGIILWQLRLPRELLAIAIGATLGMAGAALQGLLRNPLAGPDLLGVTSCAALGSVLSLYLGFAALSSWFLPLGGMLGAGLAVALVFLLAGRSASVLTLILAGMAINAIMSSLIALTLNFAPNPFAMSEMMYWLLGSIANRSNNDLLIALPFMVLGWLLIFSCGRFLDALTLGGDEAAVEDNDLGDFAGVVGVAAPEGFPTAKSGPLPPRADWPPHP